jgi:RHS repeat-associated protein
LRYIDDLVLREKGTEILYSLADPNWNVIAICDQTGNIQERYTYDAFGKQNIFDANFTTKTTTDFNWNRTFTGQVLDKETGLMLYRNRFYHVGLGRFVVRDLFEYSAGDINIYRYVRNKSIVYRDQEGLRVIELPEIDTEPGEILSVRGCKSPAHGFCKILMSSKGCKRCNAKSCKKWYDAIYEAYVTTDTPLLGTETCGRWTREFEKKLFSRIGPILDDDCAKAEEVYWKRKNARWITKIMTRCISGDEPGHAAYKITFCNGSVLYFDNGALGGIFDQDLVDRKIKSQIIE